MHRTHSIYAAFVGSSILSAAPAVALPASAADTRVSGSLEEVIVSARKRDETLISVPVVVSAVSAAELERRSITNLDGIARMVPQLMIAPQNGSVQGGNISIRGIAGPDSNPFADQAVSFNVDGVQIAKGFVRRMSDTDIAQVEVLKGPQALFFGKNSPAGIVSIRTADPTAHLEAKASVGYETEAREIRTETYVSGPITDTLGARLSGYYSNMEGWLEEQTPASSAFANHNSRNPDSRDYAVRGTLKWEPGSNFDAKLKLNYGQTKNAGPASVSEFISCPFGVRQTGSGLQCGTGDTNVNASSGPVVGTIPATQNHFGDGQNFQDQKQFLGGLEMNYDLSDALRLTSVTGYYRADLDQCQNYENDISFILPSCNPTTDREVSQEVRLTSDFKGSLNFAAGAYYSDTRAETGSMTYLFGGTFDLLGPGVGGPTTPVRINNYHLVQDGSAYSGYAQLIYKPIEVVEIDVGGRYSYEEKSLPDVRSSTDLTGFTGPFLDDSTIVTLPVSDKNWSDFSPEVTVSYRPSQTLTLFGSYKEGFLSGGFNSSSVNFLTNPDISYNPETIEGYEVGVKTLLFDDALALNAAAYQYKVTGLQVSNFTNATNTIRNAAGVKIKGAEGDFTYQTPLEGLSLHGAAAYNDGIYSSFPAAPCYNGQTPTQGCTLDALGNPTQDLGDSELIRAPEWNISGGFNLEAALSSGLKVGFSADAMYSSSFLTDATSAPNGRMPSYTLIDSSIRLGDQNEVWELALIGRNLTNKYYWVASADVPFTGSGTGTAAGVVGDRFAAVSRGREIMVRLSYKFGG